jgi:hypothetical protein
MNKIARRRDWFISFNPTPIGSGPETAICIKDARKTFGTRYLILDGDHFEALCECIELEAAIAYFHTHYDEVSSWSDEDE